MLDDGFKFQYDNTLSIEKSRAVKTLAAFKFQYDNTLSIFYNFYYIFYFII